LVITRADFAEASQGLLHRLASPVGRVLRDAELRPGDVSEIVLVGGATRAPIVVDWVRDMFGRAPLSRFNPDQVVALGAAVQAALIADDAAVSDMVMTDVCPFSLGVEIMRELGNRKEGGHFLPVIHRNTTVPVSREETVWTVEPHQRSVRVRVYQGEARRVEDNLLLGELEVTDLPGSTEPVEVKLRFSYDINGLLEVEAVIPASGKRHALVITRHAAGLPQEEVKRSLERLAQVKFYPRDNLENRRLLLFAERVVPAVATVLRAELVAGVDAYDAAMNGGTPAQFSEARAALIGTLGRLGHPYEGQSLSDR
jgi:molecular chaperone HscC